MHSTNEIEDKYLGSGKVLRYSISKHGKENHKREILEIFSNREDVRQTEQEIVNEALLKDKFCMNLCKGGQAPKEATETEFERKSASQRLAWSQPGMKEKRGKIQKEAQNRHDVKEHTRKIQKERWKDPLVREKHKISHEKMLLDKDFRRKFKEICKKAHNTEKALHNHSIAKRKLTKELVFQILDIEHKTKRKSAFIAKILKINRGAIGGVLKRLPCYESWINEWTPSTL